MTTTQQQAAKRTGETRPRTPIHRVRLKNLQELIRTRFDDTPARCAKAIGRSHTYLWQLLNEYRAIGEATARMIEDKLKLGGGTLDIKSGAFERTTMLTAHLGNGQTRNYRMVPRVTLASFDQPPSKKAEDLRPCPVGEPNGHRQCSEDTVYFLVESVSMEPRILRGELAFADRKVRKLQHDGIFVVKPKKAKGLHVVRVAQQGDDGFRLVSLRRDGSGSDSYAEKDIVVCGRVFYAAREV